MVGAGGRRGVLRGTSQWAGGGPGPPLRPVPRLPEAIMGGRSNGTSRRRSGTFPRRVPSIWQRDHPDSPMPTPAGPSVCRPLVVQGNAPPASAAAAGSFAGVGASGSAPSDSNGAVGPGYYFDLVNTRFQVFNKDGRACWAQRPPTRSGPGSAASASRRTTATRPSGTTRSPIAGSSGSSRWARAAGGRSTSAWRSRPLPTRRAATTATRSASRASPIIRSWRSGPMPTTRR